MSIDYFKGDELAADVFLNKYALKTPEGQYLEPTPDEMHKRLAENFARIERKNLDKEEVKEHLSDFGRNYLNLHKDSDIKVIEKFIYNLFRNFEYIVPQGSIMSQLGNPYSVGSLSNCFVIGQPSDSYGSIMHKDEEMVQLMKRRGGVGLDLSLLRPKGTVVRNSAKSSTGMASFMHRYSNSTREVAQDGRRGALMLSVDINHPDSMDFITAKRDLTQVTGANISVKLNKDFMKAVIEDHDYILSYPVNINHKTDPLFKDKDTEYNVLNKGSIGYYRKIKAKEYWDEIIKSAHNVAEPGLMFWDHMVNNSPDGVYPEYRPITTNPCSEIGMQPYDACRLMAINLFSFVVYPYTDRAFFDFDLFKYVVYHAMRMSDNLVDLELEHIERILDKIKQDPESNLEKAKEINLWENIYETARSSRRTGLGFTGLGDTLAGLNIKYDSNESKEFINRMMFTKLEQELECTIDLSQLRGPFKNWNPDLEFIKENGVYVNGNNQFYQNIMELYPELAEKMIKYGRRNVSWSTVAPTGTVSLMTRTTSGIEPVFMLYYMRRKKINPNDKNVKVDFVDQNGDSWQEYPVLHPEFKNWIIKEISSTGDDIPDFNNVSENWLSAWYENSPWYKSTANDIDWIDRVEIQSIIQKYTTHSISSTINLPSDVTESKVGEIYLKAWKMNLKGITVYRDGSRSGVLVANSDKKETFIETNAPKRPKELECDIHHITVKGKKWMVIVGMYESRPYEVFATTEIAGKNNSKGTLIKRKSGHYSLYSNGELIVDNISTNMEDIEEALTRSISTALRHGANIKYIAEQLNKAKGDITSFSKAISRSLKNYIHGKIKCNECKSENVVFEEGCNKCLDCGFTGCN